MKKFSKVVAVCAAAVMVLGSSLTSLAATSVSTVSATAADVSAVSAVTSDGAAVTVAAVTETVVTQAQQAAVALVGMQETTNAAAVQVEKVFDLNAVITAPTNITIAVPGITAGQQVAVLHQKADGTWESVPVVGVAARSVTATFTSLSPVAIITYAAPKTGESVPVAGVFAIVFMCGALLCTGKYAFSNN